MFINKFNKCEGLIKKLNSRFDINDKSPKKKIGLDGDDKEDMDMRIKKYGKNIFVVTNIEQTFQSATIFTTL